MPFSALRIDHVEVVVRDLAAVARWYADVLGLQEISRWHPEPVMIRAGGTKLALFAVNPDASALPAGQEQGDTLRWHRVAWLTDENGFTAAQAHLRRLGIQFSGPIDHRRSESIYLRDPDGHPLELTWYRS